MLLLDLAKMSILRLFNENLKIGKNHGLYLYFRYQFLTKIEIFNYPGFLAKISRCVLFEGVKPMIFKKGAKFENLLKVWVKIWNFSKTLIVGGAKFRGFARKCDAFFVKLSSYVSGYFNKRWSILKVRFISLVVG